MVSFIRLMHGLIDTVNLDAIKITWRLEDLSMATDPDDYILFSKSEAILL